MLGELIHEMETNKVGEERAIDIFKEYFSKDLEL